MTANKNKNLTDNEERLYKAYRRVLKSLRNTGVGHSAQRRQIARERVCERYKTTHANLKDIVSRGDQLHGIEHSTTVHEVAQKYAEVVESFTENPTPCQRCGTVSDEEDNPVKVRIVFDRNPDGEIETLCSLCYVMSHPSERNLTTTIFPLSNYPYFDRM